MKKLYLVVFFGVVCILFLFSCSDKYEELHQDGNVWITPYVYSEEEFRLMNMLHMEDDVGIVEMRIPSSIKNIVVSVYSLDTEKIIWHLEREGSFEFEPYHPLLTGNIAMYLKSTPNIRFIINLLGSAVYQTNNIVPSDVCSLNTNKVFLSEEIAADLQKELPVGMIGYTGDTCFDVMDLQDFYNPEELSVYDYAYVITVRFSTF